MRFVTRTTARRSRVKLRTATVRNVNATAERGGRGEVTKGTATVRNVNATTERGGRLTKRTATVRNVNAMAERGGAVDETHRHGAQRQRHGRTTAAG